MIPLFCLSLGQIILCPNLFNLFNIWQSYNLVLLLQFSSTSNLCAPFYLVEVYLDFRAVRFCLGLTFSTFDIYVVELCH